jgi:hypothetical protein
MEEKLDCQLTGVLTPHAPDYVSGEYQLQSICDRHFEAFFTYNPGAHAYATTHALRLRPSFRVSPPPLPGTRQPLLSTIDESLHNEHMQIYTWRLCQYAIHSWLLWQVEIWRDLRALYLTNI